MSELTGPWVYAWPQSVAAGQTVGLRAAGPPVPAELRVVRIGARPEIVWTTTIDLVPHDLPDDAASHGCPWPDAAALAIPDHWRPGYYEVVLRAGAEFRQETRGLLRGARRPRAPGGPAPGADHQHLERLQRLRRATTSTRGGTHVSFARPLAPGFLRKPVGPGDRVAVVDAPDPGDASPHPLPAGSRVLAVGGSAGWPNAELRVRALGRVQRLRAGLRGQRRPGDRARAARRSAPLPVGGPRRVLDLGDARRGRVVRGRRRTRRLPVGQHQLLAGAPRGRRSDDGGLQAAVRDRPRVGHRPAPSGSPRCGPTGWWADPRTR